MGNEKKKETIIKERRREGKKVRKGGRNSEDES